HLPAAVRGPRQGEPRGAARHGLQVAAGHPIPLHALVLAAGHGSRLRPLTEELPKPLLPVLGRPLIAHTLEALAAVGCAAVAINLHHLGEAIPRALGDRFAGMPLVYSREDPILGTGGALLPLRDFFAGSDPLLVVAGAHALAPALLARLPPGVSDSMGDLYEPLLAAGGRLATLVTWRPWHDLGTPGRYLDGVLDAARAAGGARDSGWRAPDAAVA